MLALVRSTRFRKDVKRARKRGKDMGKLREALNLLSSRADLPESYRDHALQGGLERVPGPAHRAGLAAHLPDHGL